MNNSVFSKFQELETERLVLRKISKEDAKDLYMILSDPETCKYLQHNPVEGMRHICSMIDGMKKSFEEKMGIMWGIAKREDNVLVGTCGYSKLDKYNNVGEITYHLSKELWDQGLMTETINEIVKYSFVEMELNRIEAKVIENNKASNKVLNKAGFVKEGVIRQALLKNGMYFNVVLYSRVKTDTDK